MRAAATLILGGGGATFKKHSGVARLVTRLAVLILFGFRYTDGLFTGNTALPRPNVIELSYGEMGWIYPCSEILTPPRLYK